MKKTRVIQFICLSAIALLAVFVYIYTENDSYGINRSIRELDAGEYGSCVMIWPASISREQMIDFWNADGEICAHIRINSYMGKSRIRLLPLHHADPQKYKSIPLENRDLTEEEERRLLNYLDSWKNVQYEERYSYGVDCNDNVVEYFKTYIVTFNIKKRDYARFVKGYFKNVYGLEEKGGYCIDKMD